MPSWCGLSEAKTVKKAMAGTDTLKLPFVQQPASSLRNQPFRLAADSWLWTSVNRAGRRPRPASRHCSRPGTADDQVADQELPW
jgi:hypothetical protein